MSPRRAAGYGMLAIAPAAVATGDAILALRTGSTEASGQFTPIVQNQV